MLYGVTMTWENYHTANAAKTRVEYTLIRDHLKTMEHPKKWKGKSALDYFEWYIKAAVWAGKINKAARTERMQEAVDYPMKMFEDGMDELMDKRREQEVFEKWR